MTSGFLVACISSIAVNAVAVEPPAVAVPLNAVAQVDADRVPEIFVDIRYVQVDTTRLKVEIEGYSPSSRQDGPQIAASNAIHVSPRNEMRDVHVDRSGFGEFGKPIAGPEGGAFETVVLPGLVEFRIGGQAVDPRRIPTGASPAESPQRPDGLAYMKALASPRLLVLSGQGASFASGTECAYLEKEGDDCLRLHWTASDRDDPLFSMAEGSSFEVTVTLTDDGAIRCDPMTFQYRYMTGREPIDGVPLDVGKPIIRTMKMSIALVMKQNATAVFAFPRDGEDAPLILALVRAYEKVQTPKTGDGASSRADVKP